MLENVVDDYLKSIRRERELDAPFLALLGASGFEDVHYTHGIAEFGKDFIAKSQSPDGEREQWSFQLKAGDIKQGEWRSEIMGQMLEAQLVGLSHPQFDKSLTRNAVLATNGRLVGNAATEVQDFNTTLVDKYKVESIIVWEQPQLVERFARFGLAALHGKIGTGAKGYGLFFQLYGKALDRTLSHQDLETLGRIWLDDATAAYENARLAVIAFSIIANAARTKGDLYLALQAQLNALRAVTAALWSDDGSRRQYLVELQARAIAALRGMCVDMRDDFVAFRESHESVIAMISSTAVFVLYPVLCAQIAEALALGILTAETEEEKSAFRAALLALVHNDAGLCHPISDRYAVTAVATVLALLTAGEVEYAKRAIIQTAVWLCDRYEKGVGLASVDMTADEEADYLLGFRFEGTTATVRRRQSLIATALIDLAAYTQDKHLYDDLLNDFMACGIAPQYFQAKDTFGQFLIDADDVLQYASTHYSETLNEGYAEHIRAEEIVQPRNDISVASYLGLSLLLRDRYFPGLWNRMLAKPTPSGSSEKSGLA